MSKSSSSRFFTRYFHHISSKPSTNGSTGISQLITNDPVLIQNPNTFSSWLSANSQRIHFRSSSNTPGVFGKLDPHAKLLPGKHFMGFRNFSSKNYEMGSKNFAKKVVENPALAVKTTLARYKEALGLQIEAFWKRNYMVVLGAGGLVVCILLWRVLFGIANTFIGFSEGMAKYGFLALSSAIVAFTVLLDDHNTS